MTWLSWLRSGLRAWRGYKTYEAMPSWLLGLIGAPAGLIAFYWITMVNRVAPDYIDLVNANGINTIGLVIGLWLLVIAGHGLYFGALSARAGELLYQRHFR